VQIRNESRTRAHRCLPWSRTAQGWCAAEI